MIKESRDISYLNELDSNDVELRSYSFSLKYKTHTRDK